MLHDALQIAWGWEDCHLHELAIGDVTFGVPDPEDDRLCVDERAAPLGAVVRVGSKFVYTYDHGDDWEHDITVQAQLDGRDGVIRCTGGARACPPEDGGGPFGYVRLLEILGDSRHEEHAEMKAWLGKKLTPEKFDVAPVNKKLAALSKKAARLLR